MFALSSLGAGAAAGCRRCVRLGGWHWCRCRVPLQGAAAAACACLWYLVRISWVHVMFSGAL